MKTINLPLTEPQERFVFSEAKYPAMVAGLGAGKTQAGIVRLILKMFQEKVSTAYYLPTYDLIRLRAFPGAEEILTQLGISHKTNRSMYTITIPSIGEMIFRSYDRPQRIVSYEVAHSVVDEIDTLPKDQAQTVWRKVNERNRQRRLSGKDKSYQWNRTSPNTIAVVTTPDQGYSGFVYSRWVKGVQTGKSLMDHHELIKAPTSSNPYLPPDYEEQIRSNYDPLMADMYLSGEFVSLSRNRVYHFFDRTKHDTDRELDHSDAKVHIGLDFNVGGTCATVWVIDNEVPTAVNEFVSQNTYDFCLRAEPYKRNHKVLVYPDSSGRSQSTNAAQTDIQIIESAGFTVDCPSTNPAIRDRVNTVNGLMSHGRFRINTRKCPRLADAMEVQGYDKSGQPEKFDDHPSIDDWCDSAGYYLHRKFGIKRGVIYTGIGGAM